MNQGNGGAGKGFEVFPIGVIRKGGEGTRVEIFPEYEEGLEGLDQNSHIILFCWFHKSDTPEKRRTLQVHPRRNRANPLTGVFATRSPVRPNPISIYACRLLAVEGRTIHIHEIDALDGTPIIDIKPYVPRMDALSRVRMPEWAED